MTEALDRLRHEFAGRSTGVTWQHHGQYHYQRNGEPTDIQEPWRQGTDAGGSRIIQSLRFSPDDQVLLRVDWRQLGEPWQRKQRADIDLQPGSEARARVAYQIAGKHWQCRSGDDLLHGQQEAPWHFFPLMRVFSGAMVLALQKEQPVLLPNLDLGAEAQRLLPRWDRRQSFVLEIRDGRSTYAMQGGHYRPDNARFVLADDGLLDHYHWQQADKLRWDVRLERFD